MDDSCAVCAEALEWVAYGSCGHREVCSTCVVRLRFVLDDRRCCICKSENPNVFVTKAMGDYTRVINDFSVFPSDATEGKAGSYWYHEGTEAYFDDSDHYRMIKAMCRLSCSVCDKNAEEQGSESVAKKRTKFRSIEQLKGHLFHQHRLFMCSLCLEGRKVFICEQKLYTRSQLTQHINTGDSEVDGSESERGGFMGHPMCEFCRNPFYGDNELYMHMSTEHYTCHICQRQHPGQYDYYRNYDDLETHFRQEHFLCEDEACLTKKFVVFQTESEMKVCRKNYIPQCKNTRLWPFKWMNFIYVTSGHGLVAFVFCFSCFIDILFQFSFIQIPTSFRYRRSNEQDQRRGRGRMSRPDQSVNHFSLETPIADFRDRDSSLGTRPASDQVETGQTAAVSFSLESLAINPSTEPPRSVVNSQNTRSALIIEESSFPPLSDRELPEPSSRYAQALQSSRIAARLGEESFPPLPGAEKCSKPKAGDGSKGSGKNTLAARLRHRGRGPVAIRSSAWSRPSEKHDIGSSSSASSQTRPATSPGVSSSTSASSHSQAAANQGPLSSGSTIKQVKPTKESVLMPPVSVNSPWNANAVNRMRSSASAPNLIEVGSSNHPMSTIASTVAGKQALSTGSQVLPNVEDVQTANKSLVERIRAGLGKDEDRFAAFKNISTEYRQGLINTWEYLSYVEQFGLSHLVLELARLCPDAQKQKELIDAYNANLRGKNLQENGRSNAVDSKGTKMGKGKGKGVDRGEGSGTREVLTDSILDTVRKLQSNLRTQEEEVETLSKDGYRAAKGDKLQPLAGEAQAKSSSPITILADSSGCRESPANSTGSNQNMGGGRTGKQQKKTSKFHRIRLGDRSAAALLDLDRSNGSPEPPELESSSNAPEGLPVRGVWRNGGGLRLVANSHKNSSK